MAFYDTIVGLLVLLVLWFFFTQVVIPAKRGLPLFPILREHQHLDSQLASARQEVESEQVLTTISDTRARATRQRNARTTSKGETTEQ